MKPARTLLFVLVLLFALAAGFGIGALTYEPPNPEFESIPVSTPAP